MLIKKLLLSLMTLISLSLYTQQHPPALLPTPVGFFPSPFYHALAPAHYNEESHLTPPILYAPSINIEEHPIFLDYPWNYRRGGSNDGISLQTLLARNHAFMLFRFTDRGRTIVRYAGTLKEPYNVNALEFLILKENVNGSIETQKVTDEATRSYIIQKLAPITTTHEGDERRVTITQEVCKSILDNSIEISIHHSPAAAFLENSKSVVAGLPEPLIKDSENKDSLFSVIEPTPAVTNVGKKKTKKKKTKEIQAPHTWIEPEHVAPAHMYDPITHVNESEILADKTYSEPLNLKQEIDPITNPASEEPSTFTPESSTSATNNSCSTAHEKAAQLTSLSSSKKKKKKKDAADFCTSKGKKTAQQENDEKLFKASIAAAQREREKIIAEVASYSERIHSIDNPLTEEEIKKIAVQLKNNSHMYCLKLESEEKNQAYQYQLTGLCGKIYQVPANFKRRNPELAHYLFPKGVSQLPSCTQSPAITISPSNLTSSSLKQDRQSEMYINIPDSFSTAEELRLFLDKCHYCRSISQQIKCSMAPDRITLMKELFVEKFKEDATIKHFHELFNLAEFTCSDIDKINVLETTIYERFPQEESLKKRVTNIRKHLHLVGKTEEFLENPNPTSYKELYNYCTNDSNNPSRAYKLSPKDIIPYLLGPSRLMTSDITKLLEYMQDIRSTKRAAPLKTALTYSLEYYRSLKSLTLAEFIELQSITTLAQCMDIITPMDSQEVLQRSQDVTINGPLSENDIENSIRAWHVVSFSIDNMLFALQKIQSEYAHVLYPLLQKALSYMPEHHTQLDGFAQRVKLALPPAEIALKDRIESLEIALQAIYDNEGYSLDEKNRKIIHLLTTAHQWGLSTQDYQRIYSNTLHKFFTQPCKVEWLSETNPSLTKVPISHLLAAYQNVKKNPANIELYDTCPEKFAKDATMYLAVRQCAVEATEKGNISESFLLFYYLLDILKYCDTSLEGKAQQEAIARIKGVFAFLPYSVQTCAMYYAPELLTKYQLRVSRYTESIALT